ncbi:MAG: serine/threonine protein phosphatase PrpC [Oceanicoccus sp.]
MGILQLDTAQCSIQGRKSDNEDYAVIEIPADDYLLRNKGVTLAVADGVSSAEAGKEASFTATTCFVKDYYSTPDTWSVSHCGEKILSTINLKLYRKSHDFTTEGKGFLCTFSAVVIKGKTAHYFHVGDSRVYHLREGKLNQVTRDHTATIVDGKSFLARALGMDNRLHVDYGKISLEAGDRLLISSDGIHDFLSEKELQTILTSSLPVSEIAETLKRRALDNESDDNISAVVAVVVDLPAESLDDYSTKLTRLPFPPPLSRGMKIDGYYVEEEIFASSRSQLYRVRDIETGKIYAMKTPSRNFEDDIGYIDRFIQEEWIGSRIHSPHVVEVFRQIKSRTFLYYLMEYLDGITLDKWMQQHPLPSPKKAIDIIKQVASGLQAFHDNEAVHQDIKPANIFVMTDGNVKIVDFGSVFVAGIAESYRPLDLDDALGTAGYSDPQYLLGHNAGFQGDVYSLSTITYELFTGKLPYGEKVENCTTAFEYDKLRYQNASLYNPVIPEWFDRALEKGVKFDAEQRYSNITNLIYDLTHPNPEFLKDDPIVEQKTNTLLFWKLVSSFWFITFLLVIYLFSQTE